VLRDVHLLGEAADTDGSVLDDGQEDSHVPAFFLDLVGQSIHAHVRLYRGYRPTHLKRHSWVTGEGGLVDDGGPGNESESERLAIGPHSLVVERLAPEFVEVVAEP